MDEKNVKAIQEWHIPKSITEVKSFYDLANFYKRFVKDCSTLVAHFTEIVKKISRI
jgi:ABC-type proline/glycine betaine transport system substrate-binding protein